MSPRVKKMTLGLVSLAALAVSLGGCMTTPGVNDQGLYKTPIGTAPVTGNATA
jgi:hypothetical protein